MADVAPHGAVEICGIAIYKHFAPLGREFPNTISGKQANNSARNKLTLPAFYSQVIRNIFASARIEPRSINADPFG